MEEYQGLKSAQVTEILCGGVGESNPRYETVGKSECLSVDSDSSDNFR